MLEWYEKLDFEENPFADEEAELIGYDDVLEDVFYAVAAGNIVFVESKEGRGKTALLKNVINKHRGSGKVIYVNCKKIDGDVNIEKFLIKKYGFWGRLMHNTPRDMILLVDDIQSMSKKNSERMKYFYDQNYVRSIIFTGPSLKQLDLTKSFIERINKVLKLRDLTDDEAVTIIQTRLNNNEILPEDIIKEVFNLCKKNTKEFLVKCEELCKLAVEDESNKVNWRHLETVFKEYKAPKKLHEKTEHVITISDSDLKKETKKGSEKKEDSSSADEYY